MGKSHDFPFNIMDVAELLHLRIRRPHATGYYTDCPICGDKRGKMSLSTELDSWRCNYCGEHGGMLSLYARVYHISNSEAYREICEALQNGEFAPDYYERTSVKKPVDMPEQSMLADVRTIHQTYTMLLGMLTLSKKHREHLRSVRGLTEQQIDELGYKSTPPFYLCRKLAAQLLEKGCTLQGVPGFYQKDGRWTIKFCTSTAGILIPSRGLDGLIRGMQIRLDVPFKKDDSDKKRHQIHLAVLHWKADGRFLRLSCTFCGRSDGESCFCYGRFFESGRSALSDEPDFRRQRRSQQYGRV